MGVLFGEASLDASGSLSNMITTSQLFLQVLLTTKSQCRLHSHLLEYSTLTSATSPDRHRFLAKCPTDLSALPLPLPVSSTKSASAAAAGQFQPLQPLSLASNPALGCSQFEASAAQPRHLLEHDSSLLQPVCTRLAQCPPEHATGRYQCDHTGYR